MSFIRPVKPLSCQPITLSIFIMRRQMFFFLRMGRLITQAARKIAETISDPDIIGKQALATATVVLVLLVLYLAAITFI